MARYKRTSGNGEVVEVEAYQLTPENLTELTDWCLGFAVLEHNALDPHDTMVGINVKTPIGSKRASEGSYILQYDSGEFYVYSPESFFSRYSPVEG